MSTSSSMATPTTKQVRYDRQLRLWGDHGQQRLENANVCLLNATATGTETLKSLVLPGIGRFTIIDNSAITEEDVGNNFFLLPDAVGKSRGAVACGLLKEMNSEVDGCHINESPERLPTNNLSILSPFTLVIACDLSESAAGAIGEFLWNRNVPFILCRCIGLIGYLRVIIREHWVIESHPDNPFDDLRLDRPWPELVAHVDSIDLDSLSHEDHSHVPYVVLILKALQLWRQRSGLDENGYPRSYAQKKEIKQVLAEMQKADEKGRKDEANFAEAVANLNRALRPAQIDSNMQHVFDHVPDQLTDKSPPFWFMASAIKRFTNESNGSLPVKGALPDMTAHSSRYIELQRIYQNKATSDAHRVHEYVKHHLTDVGLSTSRITFEQVLLCCKHADQMHCIKGRSLQQELTQPHTDEIQRLFISEEPEHQLIRWYIQLRARERFRAEKDRYPGTNGIPVQLDTVDLSRRVKHLLVNEWKCHGPEGDDGQFTAPDVHVDYTAEICRYGSSELHAVSAVLGGVCAHECIKLITTQYLPLNNTYVFDAHTGSALVMQM